ncbi:hypothetical protein [Actimicrobium sp. CCI2.3]|uniref:hypothetical protein n=2 Tax=Actimicrobium sp. CCI2.3 TaxID=3048616 RepID=UPI002B252083|nr:hypothetical protein [Actimicrobium sp. CCI2.3]
MTLRPSAGIVKVAHAPCPSAGRQGVAADYRTGPVMNDIAAASSHHVLKPVPGTLQLLGMAVGFVISGGPFAYRKRTSGPSGGDLAGEY